MNNSDVYFKLNGVNEKDEEIKSELAAMGDLPELGETQAKGDSPESVLRELLKGAPRAIKRKIEPDKKLGNRIQQQIREQNLRRNN